MKQSMLLAVGVLLASFGHIAAQFTVQGVIMEESEAGEFIPLSFVHVYWLGSEKGTYTDDEGEFAIEPPKSDVDDAFIETPLVVSYVGFAPDTIFLGHERHVNIVLKSPTLLEEVEVVYREKTTEISFLDPRLVENVSKGELYKAACCNLSESFETNASVDVLITDAVSGAKEIQMLGLAGKYTMLSREMMPGIRGIAVPYGMLYVPGSWIESMQISKGAGSVVQGYESISGQINIEWKKPEENEKLYLNGYLSEMLRSEINANTAFELSPALSTSLMAHGSLAPKMHDRNNDGFSDNQQGTMFAVTNRWKFNNNRGLISQFGVSYVHDDKVAGQIGYVKDEPSSGLYGVTRDAQKVDIWGKTGYIFPRKKYKSIGIQAAYSYYEQENIFGPNAYSGIQNTAYANLIYQSIIVTSDHRFKTGASLLYDGYDERVNQNTFVKNETAVGGFFEYSYSYAETFGAIAGLRVDYNDIYGTLITPRLHLRYAPTDRTVFRASAGRGFRSPNPYAENLGLLASSREIAIIGDDNDLPFGLNMESAWNFGVSARQEFTLDFREGAIMADFFHTQFTDQLVVDLYSSPREALIYNLDGRSYSTNFQVEASWEALKRLDVKLAYRRTDVKTEFTTGLKREPQVPLNRGFINMGYTTRRNSGGFWQFDGTLQIVGEQKLPVTESNPTEYLRPDNAPAFATFNTQITKYFRVGKSGTKTTLAVYVGAENLFNFRQEDPIIAADDPFGPYFDSGFVWGPIFGRNVYAGVRYILDKRDE